MGAQGNACEACKPGFEDSDGDSTSNQLCDVCKPHFVDSDGDPTPNELCDVCELGWADADGDNAVVAAHDENGVGAVWALGKNGYTWTAQTPLPSDGEEMFGWDVAIRGETIVVGSPGYGGGRGAAHVFKKNQDGAWYLQQILEPENAPPTESALAVPEDDIRFMVHGDGFLSVPLSLLHGCRISLLGCVLGGSMDLGKNRRSENGRECQPAKSRGVMAINGEEPTHHEGTGRTDQL